MATRDRRIRKFEPGTYQEERFALAKQAIMAHRRYGKSDVATVQLASPSPVSSSSASISTRMRNYVDRQNAQLAGLSYVDRLKTIFPRPTRSREAALQTTAFESPVAERVFRIGGGKAVDLKRRLSSQRFKEIISEFFRASGIRVFSGERDLAQAIQEAGASAEEARQAVASKGLSRKVGGSFRFPHSVKAVFIAGSEQVQSLAREYLGKELSDPSRFRMGVAAHEASEEAIRTIYGTGMPVGTHANPSIYKAEFELSAMVGPDVLRSRLRRQVRQLPNVIKEIQGWTDRSKRDSALSEIHSLPGAYGRILKRRGYTPQQVSELVTPISNILGAGATKPKPQIATPARVKAAPVKQPLLEQVSPVLSEFNKKYSGLRITPGYAMGTSSWARWQREGRIPKESVQWAIDDSSSKFWKGFYLKYGDKEHLLDLTQKGSSRLLEDLELKVAQGVDDTSVVQAIQADRAQRAAAVRSAASREYQSIGDRAAVIHPKKRGMRQAARKAVEKATVAEAQKVAEFKLPAGLEDYVSGGIKQFQEHHSLSILRRAAPYAIGIAAGADILTSRDKTGPFWGGAAAGLAWLLTRGKAPRNTRFLIAGGSYAAGRVLGGALATAHSGQLEGFPEQGFAVAERRTHTDFGSGWQGIFGVPKAIRRAFEGLLSRSHRRGVIPAFQNVRPNPTLKNWAHKSEGEFSGPLVDLFNKMSEPYFEAGIAQAEIIEGQKAAGVWKDLLPVIRHDSYSYKGLQRSYAHPTMKFSADDVSDALVEYAREKGIKNVPNFWRTVGKSANTATAVVQSPAFDAFEAVVNKEVPSGNLAKTASVGSSVHKAMRMSPASGGVPRQEARVGQGGSRPRSVNEAAQASGTPAPAFHRPIAPFETDRVEPAKSVVKTAMAAPVISPEQMVKAENNFRRDYKDFAYSSPHGALMRSSRPKVLESFKKSGVAGAVRKINTEGDFGTGWDPARRLAKALFGKAAKEGADVVARGAAYKDILRSEEFQRAITSGDAKVIKQLGSGGIGSVELMETTIGGEKFRFARKEYFGGLGKGMEAVSEESAGLRAMQDSIAPSVYGRGVIAKEGRKVPVMYFEAIEDAIPAAEAFKEFGGAKQEQVKALKGALKDLHSKGLYHSDVKPANMLVDKEGRLVLIDPMPGRYKDMGKSVAKALGQEQDMMAVDILASGGSAHLLSDPISIRGQMNNLANSFFYATGGPEMYPKHYKRGLKYVQEIFKRAGITDVADRYGIPMSPVSNVSPMPVVGSGAVKVADDLPGATKRTARAKPRRQGRTQRGLPPPPPPVNDVKVTKRERLHEVAVRTVAENNRNPSRRHRTM